MKKFHFIFDKTKKAQSLKKIIFKNNHKLSFSDCIIVAGGDGFMLNIIKRYFKYNKPFYGINCGSYGFLMNKYNSKNIERKISKAKQTIINPLSINALTVKNNKKKLLAINDASLYRQSRQTASLKLLINKKIILKKLIGDGIIVSTPAGSTAYNLSVHGPILSLNSEKLAITPISPFRPRRWKGKIISNKLTVKISNLDHFKRPVALTADNIEIRNIRNLSINVNKNIRIKLLYDRDRSLVKKIKVEQALKNIR